jgi:hypothetical protein
MSKKCHERKSLGYSITSSARAGSVGGKVSPMDIDSYNRWYDCSRARDLMLK